MYKEGHPFVEGSCVFWHLPDRPIGASGHWTVPFSSWLLCTQRAMCDSVLLKTHWVYWIPGETAIQKAWVFRFGIGQKIYQQHSAILPVAGESRKTGRACSERKDIPTDQEKRVVRIQILLVLRIAPFLYETYTE